MPHYESVSVDGVIKCAKRLVEKHAERVRHLPTLLKQAKLASYQSAVDDMLITLDLNKLTEKAIEKALG